MKRSEESGVVQPPFRAGAAPVHPGKGAAEKSTYLEVGK
jgi:hypothetical protein